MQMQIDLSPKPVAIRLPAGDRVRFSLVIKDAVGQPLDLGPLTLSHECPIPMTVTKDPDKRGYIYLVLGPATQAGSYPIRVRLEYPNGDSYTVFWGTVVVEAPPQ